MNKRWNRWNFYLWLHYLMCSFFCFLSIFENWFISLHCHIGNNSFNQSINWLNVFCMSYSVDDFDEMTNENRPIKYWRTKKKTQQIFTVNEWMNWKTHEWSTIKGAFYLLRHWLCQMWLTWLTLDGSKTKMQKKKIEQIKLWRQIVNTENTLNCHYFM